MGETIGTQSLPEVLFRLIRAEKSRLKEQGGFSKRQVSLD